MERLVVLLQANRIPYHIVSTAELLVYNFSVTSSGNNFLVTVESDTHTFDNPFDVLKFIRKIARKELRLYKLQITAYALIDVEACATTDDVLRTIRLPEAQNFKVVPSSIVVLSEEEIE